MINSRKFHWLMKERWRDMGSVFDSEEGISECGVSKQKPHAPRKALIQLLTTWLSMLAMFRRSSSQETSFRLGFEYARRCLLLQILVLARSQYSRSARNLWILWEEGWFVATGNDTGWYDTTPPAVPLESNSTFMVQHRLYIANLFFFLNREAGVC